MRVSLPFSLSDSDRKRLTLHRQGWYLPEAAHPYYILASDFEIEFAAPAGANPPIDPSSVQVCSLPYCVHNYHL